MGRMSKLNRALGTSRGQFGLHFVLTFLFRRQRTSEPITQSVGTAVAVAVLRIAARRVYRHGLPRRERGKHRS